MKKNILLGIIVTLVVVILVILACLIFNRDDEPDEPKTSNNQVDKLDIDFKHRTLNGDIDKKNKLLTTYDEFKTEMDLLNIDYLLTENDFINNNYIEIIITDIDECHETVNSIKSIDINNDKVNIVFNLSVGCGVCPVSPNLYLIPIEKNKLSSYSELSIDYKIINKVKCDPNVSYKPIIYLYPTKDMNVNVKLSNPENLTTTYPKYNSGWDVYAKTNGDLIDANGRTYYALYWEGLTYTVDNNIREGFVVKSEDSIKFLEEKLPILGLNERETNEFIMYWLPQLEQNKYNYIRFASMEEINNSNALIISPTPDNIIRVLMVFKPLEEKINIKEQVLETPSRTGFTVVEWGGVKIK